MNIFGYLRSTTAKFSSSCFVYTAPLGFEGELNQIIFVLGVIAFSNCSGVILKLFSIVVGTSTGTPCAILIISE